MRQDNPVVRMNCIHSSSAVTVVVIALEYVEEDAEGKARKYLLSIKTFDSCDLDVLHSLLPPPNTGQTVDCGGRQGGNHYTRPAAAGEADTEAWNAFFDSAVKLQGYLRLRRTSRAVLVDRGTVRTYRLTYPTCCVVTRWTFFLFY